MPSLCPSLLHSGMLKMHKKSTRHGLFLQHDTFSTRFCCCADHMFSVGISLSRDDTPLDGNSLMFHPLTVHLCEWYPQDVTFLDGVFLNETYLNGTPLYATHLNGGFLDGTSLNGTYNGSTFIDGTSLDSISLDGTSLDGISLVATWMLDLKVDRPWMIHPRMWNCGWFIPG